MNLAIMGPRPGALGGPQFKSKGGYYDMIGETILKMYAHYNPSYLFTGVVHGVDMLAAELALVYGIPLVSVCPLQYHYALWDREEVLIAREILKRSVHTVNACTEWQQDMYEIAGRKIINSVNALVIFIAENEGTMNELIAYADKKHEEKPFTVYLKVPLRKNQIK